MIKSKNGKTQIPVINNISCGGDDTEILLFYQGCNMTIKVYVKDMISLQDTKE